MSFVNLKPGTLLSPTGGDGVLRQQNHRPNIITIAWTGTVNSDPPMLSISVRPERHSHDIIRESGEFVVNLVSRPLMKVDLCGVRSGRDFDVQPLHFRAAPARGMAHAPAIDGSPAYLACAEGKPGPGLPHPADRGIISMGIQESLMDHAGKIHFSKADLIAYCHGEYTGLTQPEGFFGYSIARPGHPPADEGLRNWSSG